jgi:hypothetical protein
MTSFLRRFSACDHGVTCHLGEAASKRSVKIDRNDPLSPLHQSRQKVANKAMPRGSKPGERRGGRQPGTPNKTTVLANTAFAAATSNPELLPLDFLLAVMRDPSIPADWRFRAAQAAAPYLHPKPERAQAIDPEPSAKQIESESGRDPLAEAIEAFRRGEHLNNRRSPP